MVAATYQFHIDTARGNGTAFAAAADNLTSFLIGNINYNVGMSDADQSFAAPSRLTVTLDNINGDFNPDVIGAEVLTNGTFATWSADNPSSWTVSGEVGSDPEVSQVDMGETHNGVGTGAANFYSTSASMNISQTPLTSGITYKVELEISTAIVNTGYLTVTGSSVNYHLPGSYTYFFNATSTSFAITSVGVVDMTVNSVSVKAVSKYGHLLSEGMLCRLLITSGATNTSYIGKLANYEVLPGSINRRVAVITVSDWTLNFLDTEYVPPLYTNTTLGIPMSVLLQTPLVAVGGYMSDYWLLGVQGSSELGMNTTLAGYTGTPSALIQTSITTAAFVGDNALDGEDGISAQSFLRSLVDAEVYGRFFYNPAEAGYEFHNRHRDALATSSYTLTENDYEPSMSAFWRVPVINKSTVTFAPRSTGTPATVIWEADDVPIGMFAEMIKITARYRDLANPSARTGATNIIPLFPSTDYVIIEPSSGENVSGSVSVSMVAGANSAEITIDNRKNTFAINITTLQIRGTPILTFSQRTVTSESSDSKYKYLFSPEQVKYDLIDTVNLAQNIADFRVYRNADPVSAFKTIGWVLNNSSDRMTRGLGMTVGKRITISDSWMQHSADYIVVGFRHTIILGGENHHEINCILKSCEREAFWVLNTSTLGTNTRLGL